MSQNPELQISPIKEIKMENMEKSIDKSDTFYTIDQVLK